MADVRIARIDNRYIHGQVAARITKEFNISKIVLVDDVYAKNEMMKKIFLLAVIPGTTIDIVTVEDAVANMKAGKYERERTMLIWGNVDTAFRTYQAGWTFSELNIGNLGGGPGRKQVDKSCYIDEKDAEQLKELAQDGVEVVFQAMTDLPKTTLKEALKNTGL